MEKKKKKKLQKLKAGAYAKKQVTFCEFFSIRLSKNTPKKTDRF